jgi:hypothetical protein
MTRAHIDMALVGFLKALGDDETQYSEVPSLEDENIIKVQYSDGFDEDSLEDSDMEEGEVKVVMEL